METAVWVVQTTLPGDWSEAMVGEWCFDLVDAGLMACAHHSKIRSTYRWEGAIQSDPEWRIQCKTSETSKQSLIDEIHSNIRTIYLWWFGSRQKPPQISLNG